MISTYESFRDGVGGQFVRREFGVDLAGTVTWLELKEMILASRRKAGVSATVDAWRDRYHTMSTGDRALMLAVLHAADYTWLADELQAECERSFFDLMESVHGEWAWAIAACIARLDGAVMQVIRENKALLEGSEDD